MLQPINTENQEPGNIEVLQVPSVGKDHRLPCALQKDRLPPKRDYPLHQLSCSGRRGALRTVHAGCKLNSVIH